MRPVLILIAVAGWLGAWHLDVEHRREVRQLEQRVRAADAQVGVLRDQLDGCLVSVRVSELGTAVDENTRAVNRGTCAVALMSQAKGRTRLPERLNIVRESCEGEL